MLRKENFKLLKDDRFIKEETIPWILLIVHYFPEKSPLEKQTLLLHNVRHYLLLTTRIVVDVFLLNISLSEVENNLDSIVLLSRYARLFVYAHL